MSTLISKKDGFWRQSIAGHISITSIVDILSRDNVDVKRVRIKNGECEKKLKPHFLY